MNEVVNSHLVAVAIAAVLLFGNELLVHHLLVTQCIAIKILEYVRMFGKFRTTQSANDVCGLWPVVGYVGNGLLFFLVFVFCFSALTIYTCFHIVLRCLLLLVL